MPIDYPFRTSPQLGPALTVVIDPPAHYDGNQVTVPSYQLGQIHQGSDGYDYIWVEASANIAAAAAPGTEVAITDPAFTAATGVGGGWYAPIDGVTDGQFFHARRSTI